MRRRFTCRPSTKAIKAATSTADMLAAFEGKLSEFDVDSKTDVYCSSGDLEMDDIMTKERSVEISDTDYQYSYKDVEGGFGDPGQVYTLAEIKDFWNRENMNDPVLEDYTSYDTWWNDTLKNFLKEV